MVVWTLLQSLFLKAWSYFWDCAWMLQRAYSTKWCDLSDNQLISSLELLNSFTICSSCRKTSQSWINDSTAIVEIIGLSNTKKNVTWVVWICFRICMCSYYMQLFPYSNLSCNIYIANFPKNNSKSWHIVGHAL